MNTLPMLNTVKMYLTQRSIESAMECINLADDGHDVHHVNAVVMNAVKLVDLFPELERHRSLIIVGAFLHDVGCYINRENHHLESARIAINLLSENEGKRYTQAQIFLVANAIAQHRASYRQRRVDPVSEAVAAADRGEMGNPQHVLMRSVWSRIGRVDTIPHDVLMSCIEHVKEKSDSNGYMWKTIPSFTLRAYPQACADIKEFLDPSVEEIYQGLVKTGITGYDGRKYTLQPGQTEFKRV